MTARFPDRSIAGHRLARAVEPFLDGRAGSDVVVLGLAPGGLPVAAEVAGALGAPLDATVVRPLIVPGHDRPVGAMANGDPPLLDRYALKGLGLTAAELAAHVRRERVEVRRREAGYRHGRAPLPLRDKAVVLVSDGLVDPLAARAAVRSAAGAHPDLLLLAAPVCDARIAADLRRDVDALVCLHLPRYAHAAGPWYAEFHQVTDDEAALLLRRPDPAARGS